MGYYGNDFYPGELFHHGVKGQKWGVRRYQNKDGTRIKHKIANTPDELSSYMKKNIKYDSSIHDLKNVEKLLSDKSGNCHDQTYFEMEQLKQMGKNPKAKFLIEVDENGQGGMTHSFAYYKDDGKIKYLENAWGGHEGIKEFSTEKELTNYFEKKHKSGEFGNGDKFTKLYWGEFNGEPGDSLQQIVDKSLD